MKAMFGWAIAVAEENDIILLCLSRIILIQFSGLLAGY
jgi:hypothetical protein